MTRYRKVRNVKPNTVRRAVLYARVSSKEQEREGFSIPAQLELLRNYAIAQGITITEEFIDVETAKESGRGNFNNMVRYLRRHKNVATILVEKTDRLYRNFSDMVTLDKMDVELHFVKEGSVISDESRSSEKFVHGIKVLMAKQYIDNLSEEVHKGMKQKAKEGIYPSSAPMGYMNASGPDGKRIIQVDPNQGPIVRRMFELYATGSYSNKELAGKAQELGFKTRKPGATLAPGTVHKMMQNPFYKGQFKWLGKLHEGLHEPLVSEDLWDRVQFVLSKRSNAKSGASVNKFAFTGMVTCGHCGCALVGEIKKKKYIYYHCTGFKGKCGEPYTPEKVLEDAFTANLRRLRLDDDVFRYIQQALRESFGNEQREHSEAIKRLEEERDQFQRRIEAMYVDKIDGNVSEEFYDRMMAQWREGRDRCVRDITRHQSADDAYMDDGIALLEMAKDAHRHFAAQPADEKSRLLKILVSNSSWKDGKLHVDFIQPFDLLAETVASAPPADTGRGPISQRYQNWRPQRESNPCLHLERVVSWTSRRWGRRAGR